MKMKLMVGITMIEQIIMKFNFGYKKTSTKIMLWLLEGRNLE